MRSQTNKTKKVAPDPENPAVRIGILYGIGPYPVRPVITDPLGNMMFYLPELAEKMLDHKKPGFFAKLFGLA